MSRNASPNSSERAAYAHASMRRVLRKLEFETHPIRNRPCCALVHRGDVVMLDEAEVRHAADRALHHIVDRDLRRFEHLPDVRLDAICRLRLAALADGLSFRSSAS